MITFIIFWESLKLMFDLALDFYNPNYVLAAMLIIHPIVMITNFQLRKLDEN